MLNHDVDLVGAVAEPHPLRQCLSQITARGAVSLPLPQTSLREGFAEHLPRKPYAVDHLPGALLILSRAQALSRRHIQFNHPAACTWLVHDLDRRDACLAHRDANLPPPNVITINPANGHAHAAYLLATPVARHSAARLKPLQYLAAIERGIARRLGADPQYGGLIAKNPVHPDWRVEWRRDDAYSLAELESWLFARDMAPVADVAVGSGLGRNCILFDALRQLAYREVLSFKREADVEAYRRRLTEQAIVRNNDFSVPLHFSELRGIAKSVARWTWRHFSDAGLKAWRSNRANKAAARRWANHISVESTKPWIVEGISRSTWYRRRKLRPTPQLTSTISDQREGSRP